MPALSILAPLAATALTLGVLAWRHHHKKLWQAEWFCFTCGQGEHQVTNGDLQTIENGINNSALNHATEHHYGYAEPQTTTEKPAAIVIREPRRTARSLWAGSINEEES